MFGHQDDDQAKNDNKIPDHSIDGALSADNPQSDHPASGTWDHPGTPISDDSSDSSAPGSGQTHETVVSPDHPPTPVPEEHDHTLPLPPRPDAGPSPDADSSSHELIELKQQALTQLSPLVNHLEQSPEEKFRTLMMMIQASDDQSMIQAAYDAAQKIEDEPVRAQALLDIVNEINYFTQPPGN